MVTKIGFRPQTQRLHNSLHVSMIDFGSLKGYVLSWVEIAGPIFNLK